MWCASGRQQLHPFKTELIWFGSRAKLEKISTTGVTSLHVVNDVVHALRDLDVTLDSQLSVQQRVNKVARTCFFHIRRLKQVCRLLGSHVAARLVGVRAEQA